MALATGQLREPEVWEENPQRINSPEAGLCDSCTPAPGNLLLSAPTCPRAGILNKGVPSAGSRAWQRTGECFGRGLAFSPRTQRGLEIGGSDVALAHPTHTGGLEGSGSPHDDGVRPFRALLLLLPLSLCPGVSVLFRLPGDDLQA